MTHRALAEVRARLEEMDARLAALEPTTDPQAIYDRYEQLAIAILDSEHMDYREGELEEYLLGLLHLRALEVGLMQFPQQPATP